MMSEVDFANKEVTVVTICYNSVKDIERTILSVISQDYSNIQYIVIDGGSTDGTLDIIERYEEFIDIFVSEPDKGIFDAMNKGIRRSTGIWINFMNSGDRFADRRVLSRIFESSNFADKVLIYGDKQESGIVTQPLPLESIELGEIMANHQCMLFNFKLAGSHLMYDLKYPLYSDYDLVARLYCLYGQEKFQYFPMVIADYQGGGVSAFISSQKRKDRYRSVFNNFGAVGVFKAVVNWFVPVRKVG